MNIDEAIERFKWHKPYLTDESWKECYQLAIDSMKMRKRNDQLVQQKVEYQKGYSKALEDFKKFSTDYNSCNHNCDAYGSCIDCFINIKKGTKDGLS